ncbi:energy transducer TonB [Corallococcus macrosporus]|uniref:energy transducer TonB n=1 Tax=Corallococcus macrosporus TaxID=35 RepID=UPI0005BE4499|nr:energy transducer TonB [Corallococcus macrosporus]
MKVRTILNFEFPRAAGNVAPTVVATPAGALFRMGESSTVEGFWRRWSGAVTVAFALHVAAVAAGLSVSSTPPRKVVPEEPELVLLALAAPPPPPPAGGGASPRAAVKKDVQRQARPRPTPRVVPTPVPRPEPVAEVKPETPPEPEPVPAPEPTPEPQVAQAEPAVDSGSAVVGGVIGGVVGGVVGGTVGGIAGSTAIGGTGDALTLKQVMRPPTVVKQVTPKYPRLAKQRNIQGVVLVRVIVGTDGRVEPEHTKVMRSVPALDAAAMAAVNQWRFTPALGRTGRLARVMIDIPVNFSLR